ncbi:MAG: hypothetical protein UY62_C0005G0014 [Parcubacteria group bacterium GW2011_GWF2_50_9]|nr:MAG: hypothetical protein UY62_C0005G0014 [Parcubacteria group bacterium GW2011_GWF2_50_9]
MKIKITLEAKLEMGQGDIYGTALMGYMPSGTYYTDLVRVFGEPQSGRSPDGKIQVEWFGRINGLVFTIYDYKTCMIPKDNIDWHIGGDHKLTAALVAAYFEKAKLEAEKGGTK